MPQRRPSDYSPDPDSEIKFRREMVEERRNNPDPREDSRGKEEPMRHMILQVLEKHDGLCMDNALEREKLADALATKLASPTFWDNNEVQFARLIEEVGAAGGFTPSVLDDLKASMDMDLLDIQQLRDRAQVVFDKAKAKLRKGRKK